MKHDAKSFLITTRLAKIWWLWKWRSNKTVSLSSLFGVILYDIFPWIFSLLTWLLDDEEMAELVNLVKRASEKLALRINKSKTKVMLVDRTKSLPVFTALRDYVKGNAFLYSDSIIEADGNSLAEIWHRIALSKSSMARLSNVTCNNKIHRKTRKKTKN